MVLTAQRVRSTSGREGINAFCSLHGGCVWDGPPPGGIPEQNPGERANQHVTVPPGGNRVRSYLDIIAPDETPTREVLASLGPFVAAAREQGLPWAATVGRCTFRFGVDGNLAAAWAAEFRALFEAAVAVRVAV